MLPSIVLESLNAVVSAFSAESNVTWLFSSWSTRSPVKIANSTPRFSFLSYFMAARSELLISSSGASHLGFGSVPKVRGIDLWWFDEVTLVLHVVAVVLAVVGCRVHQRNHIGEIRAHIISFNSISAKMVAAVVRVVQPGICAPLGEHVGNEVDPLLGQLLAVAETLFALVTVAQCRVAADFLQIGHTLLDQILVARTQRALSWGNRCSAQSVLLDHLASIVCLNSSQ
ncbi:hypothetical protein OGAPHI_006825 [Ogataea philodendri]|uniref:Uncharacterized protein n=1 Tax=Ogataea philodendri TaxID=1378263 RepID=A0A9P8NW71_9ASCO|nr:uncharacterized protein OGAPHI_006825 [Ogataea philodendri]KAH3661418.1 hypothetical protein OGAPHI_006825 [Ogataea philodendri]